MPDTDTTYTNPIGGPISIADPFVLKADDAYYLYGTTARDGFRAWTSPDLVNWKSIDYVFQATEDTWGTKSFWAPEVIA